MRRTLISLVNVIVLLASLDVVFGDAGGKAGAFLRIPVGARPAGMGNAFVAIANDASALSYNPGAMFQINSIAFGGMYSRMSMGRKHYQASLILANPRAGALGIMLTNYGVSNIDGRDESGNQTSEFNDNEIALSLGYGRELLPFLGIGGTVKYIQHSISDYKATGMGYDFGVLAAFKFGYSKANSFNVGVCATNLAGKLNWDTESAIEESIPYTLRSGVSLNLSFNNTTLVFSAEYDKTDQVNQVWREGGELWINRAFALRTGLNGKDLQFGGSLRLGWLQLDYSYCPDILDEGATSRIGIQLLAPEQNNSIYPRGWGY